MLKKYIGCILFCILLGSVFADTAAFACFQNKDAHEKCKNITEIFEDTLFESFFEQGFIVTNVPVGEIKSENEISISAIKALFEEGPKYLIIFYMQYGAELLFNKKTELKEVDWKKITVHLLEAENEKEIYKKTIDITKLKEKDIEIKTQKLAGQISKEIFEAISRK